MTSLALELSEKLGDRLDSHMRDLLFIMGGDEPPTKAEVLQLANLSLDTQIALKNAIVKLANSIA